ncbi:MAG: hypothetical protein K6F23_15735 [Solobacterium sp.]|nr:hypothetical protein [Solobacterium sp.]
MELTAKKIVYYMDKAGLLRALPDEPYLKLKFRVSIGKELDLENPLTFNEKMQWLKLYDRRPEYRIMADKYRVREYIAGKIGEKYLVPSLGVWDDPDDIDFDMLPDKFVLKCNHTSGLGVCICGDRSRLDQKAVIRELKKGMAHDYYVRGREWPYKDMPRKIIGEQYLEDAPGKGNLTDYKIHCYGGQPRSVQVMSNRFGEGGMISDYYDSVTWEKLDMRRGTYRNDSHVHERPDELPELLELAEILSKDIPYLRTDFYIVDHKIYFGELTLFPASGFNPFNPEKYDYLFGSWITLPDHKTI